MAAFYDSKNSASRAKSKDGDESVKMADALGSDCGSWMKQLNEGSESPYPSTASALKAKNSRKSNE